MKANGRIVAGGNRVGGLRAACVMRSWMLVICALLFVEPVSAWGPGRRCRRKLGGKPEVTVATLNLYLGADVGRVMSETDPTQIPVRVE